MYIRVYNCTVYYISSVSPQYLYSKKIFLRVGFLQYSIRKFNFKEVNLKKCTLNIKKQMYTTKFLKFSIW